MSAILALGGLFICIPIQLQNQIVSRSGPNSYLGCVLAELKRQCGYISTSGKGISVPLMA